VALMGYGAGLLGLVAVKVLVPGYFASQNIKTPALIGIAVLIITQALNFVFVPLLAHAGLALAIGVGAMVNALWLLIGLLRNRTYIPQPGWGRFALQVLAASALLAVFLMWANGSVPWLALKAEKFQRIGWLALYVSSAIAIYFVAIWAAGLNLRQLLRR
jgi:putative peptidoglycan lipid II flippase